jgi:predicted dehydrogenase
MDQELIRSFGRRVRLGMVGGGSDSIIGGTHLLALRTDGYCELVAGAMSVQPDVALSSAQSQMIDRERAYADWRVMLEREAKRSDRIDAVVIATPPQLHFPIAKGFLERGIDVICEKPMTRDLAEAQELVRLVRDNDRIFCLTHCYSGFPMTRQARALIKQGAIGRVRMIDVIFAVGDPGTSVDPENPADRHWRFRATSIGKASILGEVNSHAYHMAGFITGLQGQRVSAHLATFARNREVFDNIYATVEFSDGAAGRFWSSYVAAGNDQGFSFVIIGETGQLRWSEEDPEYLWLKPIGGPAVRHSRGYDTNDPSATRHDRFRAGYAEGYGLAFANLYVDFAQAVMARQLGRPYREYLAILPSVVDGESGMKFIEAATLSHEQGGRWVDCAPPT